MLECLRYLVFLKGEYGVLPKIWEYIDVLDPLEKYITRLLFIFSNYVRTWHESMLHIALRRKIPRKITNNTPIQSRPFIRMNLIIMASIKVREMENHTIDQFGLEEHLSISSSRFNSIANNPQRNRIFINVGPQVPTHGLGNFIHCNPPYRIRRQSNVNYLGLKLRDTFRVSKV